MPQRQNKVVGCGGPARWRSRLIRGKLRAQDVLHYKCLGPPTFSRREAWVQALLSRWELVMVDTDDLRPDVIIGLQSWREETE